MEADKLLRDLQRISDEIDQIDPREVNHYQMLMFGLALTTREYLRRVKREAGEAVSKHNARACPECNPDGGS